MSMRMQRKCCDSAPTTLWNVIHAGGARAVRVEEQRGLPGADVVIVHGHAPAWMVLLVAASVRPFDAMNGMRSSYCPSMHNHAVPRGGRVHGVVGGSASVIGAGNVQRRSVLYSSP